MYQSADYNKLTFKCEKSSPQPSKPSPRTPRAPTRKAPPPPVKR